MDMKISKRGLDFIKKEEGCVLWIYLDQAGKRTIGIGHLVRKGEDFSAGISLEKALEILDKDCDSAESCVNRLVTRELEQHQFDMLVDFTFNCGTGAFSNSTLRKVINIGRMDLVPAELKKWNKARDPNGKLTALPVLSARRKREIEVFQNGYKEEKDK